METGIPEKSRFQPSNNAKPMKKILVWTGISLAGLVLLLSLAIGIALWFVFTPEKLTPIVRSQASTMLSCETQIGEVELSFFSTFPQFSLKVKDIALINPMNGAPSDTLLCAGNLVGSLDLEAWWKRNELIINEIKFKNGFVNLYTDPQGNTNYDVVRIDTTSTTEGPETSFHFIRLDKVIFNQLSVLYDDRALDFTAEIRELKGDFSVTIANDSLEGLIRITNSLLSMKYEGEQYFDHVTVGMYSPLNVDLNQMCVAFGSTMAELNQMNLTFSGTVCYDSLGQVVMDLAYESRWLPLKGVLALVPPSYQSYLEGMTADGTVSSDGSIRGIYNDTGWPWFDMHILLKDGTLRYEGFPLPMSELNGEFQFASDLTNDDPSYFRIDRLSGRTPESDFQTSGLITHLFGDMHLKLQSEGKLTLSEFATMLPSEPKMEVNGIAVGSVHTAFSMSELDKMQLNRMKLQGKVTLSHFNSLYDTIRLQSDQTSFDFELPNRRATSLKTAFVLAHMRSKNLTITSLHDTYVRLTNAVLKLESSDFTNASRVPDVFAAFGLDSLNAQMDTIRLAARQPNGWFSLGPRYDHPLIAEIAVNLIGDDLKAAFGSGFSAMDHLSLTARLTDDTEKPKMKIDYAGENLYVAMGADSARMKSIHLSADVLNDKLQKEVLQQWQASGFLKFDKGLITLEAVPFVIDIPTVQMHFDPEVLTINDSRLLIGNSDFSLNGTLTNILSYAKNDSLLRGDFNFDSRVSDLVQLMALTSGIGEEASENESVAPSEASSDGPYMVPKGVDFNLNVDVGLAHFGSGVANDIKGKLRVKDGVLVLDDFNFITPAAQMGLTAVYRTPRKNHLFMGLEFHMLNIEISELLKIIPDVDSLMPMLRSFSGKGEYHMAAETYLDSLYNVKKSTIRGAASIRGQDLVLMDGETFTEIAKTLKFRKQTINKVDSLSAEFTVFKKEIDVYPFLIVMDKYKAVVAGRHNLDMTFDYNISVVDSPLPLKFGIDITGNLDDLKYRPVKCRYPEMYRPVARGEVKNSQLELRKMIRESLVKK